VQGMNESRDTTFVGPALANTVRACDGKVEMLSFWTFSDVFEEDGPIPQPFEGHFGLRAKGGINKPSYYAFGLLHQLGDKRIPNDSKNLIVTTNSKGELVIAAWNLVDPDQQGTTRWMELVFQGVAPDAAVRFQSVDNDHGSTLKAYQLMGRPLNPTPAQVDQLNRASALAPPEHGKLKDGRLVIELSPNALALITVGH
ncbi:MAG TPA: glycosyl hydrolase family 39, partial [Terriglobia bacterium]|nr:glycosyl hydrolase family 39 [Terriglobia bacterium]